MELELRFFANFREAVGQKTIHREYDDGATVGEILASLEAEYPDMEGDLLEDGAIRDQLSILKNGRDVVHMEGVETVMEDGDRLSVFPPVAGGGDGATGSEPKGDSPGPFGEVTVEVDEGGVGHVEKSFRGISERLALEYLVGLGGERAGDHAVAGDDWRVTTSAEKVPIYEGSTMQLTEVTVAFEGDPERLAELVPAFSRKAVRAGG